MMNSSFLRRAAHLWVAVVGLSGSLLVGPAAAADPTLVGIAVYPPDVELATSRDRQSLVVQATYSNGVTRDVTGESQITVGNGALVKLQGATLYPTADGATEAKIEYGGFSVTAPVVVKTAGVDRPISFKLDVMPVFAKSGCNMGSCHGAARGKDGFRLSLFGFDPDGDLYRLTREFNGRRINLALPHDSLLMEKSCGKVPHTGGKRFGEDSELYQTLIRWLEAGAPGDPADVAKAVSIEVYPKNSVLDGQGATQQFSVRAKYSDGTDRDVTSLAFFMSNNETSASISPSGLVTAGERGEAFIMARFDTFTVGSHLIVLPKGLEFEFPSVPTNNYVDELIYAKLKKLRITPSEVCSDEVFLRRVYLDVIGLLPTEEEYHRFMTNPSSQKREELVDELLQRKEFVELWVMKFAELLQIRSNQQVSYKSALLYFNWLKEQLAANRPMNELVQELLGSSGGTFSKPPTNYYQIETELLRTTENVAQVFMGMRIQCAQCHNHPFDRWTMDDYYGFAAFFSQIGRKRGEDQRETIVFNAGGGEVKHPVGGRNMAPKFLGGATPDVAGKDRREVLAKWLASDENPYFATNLANIVWAHFLGRGIINEVDDVRVSNPAVNPELLEALGKKFTEYKYDFRKLVRDICTSRTYQMATQTNESNASDGKNFSHAQLRRVRAEVVLDCIAEVCSAKNKFQGLPLGARAVQIADGSTSTYFLTTFGRASRETVCSCEVRMEPNLSQALHLMNGDTVINAIRNGKLISEMLKEQKTPEQVLESIYIRALTRKPTPEESAALMQLVNEQQDKNKALEDIFWAVLNSREFVFNH
ncbi:MAG TPA: DUF1549 domain-containing protein [Pirellulales bacterium]